MWLIERRRGRSWLRGEASRGRWSRGAMMTMGSLREVRHRGEGIGGTCWEARTWLRGAGTRY